MLWGGRGTCPPSSELRHPGDGMAQCASHVLQMLALQARAHPDGHGCLSSFNCSAVVGRVCLHAAGPLPQRPCEHPFAFWNLPYVPVSPWMVRIRPMVSITWAVPCRSVLAITGGMKTSQTSYSF